MDDDDPHRTGTQGGREAALRISGLNKHYGGIPALRDVDLDIRRGEVHALVGGNGSGKSTLIKILAGVERADGGGELELGGRAVGLSGHDPDTARAAGLRFVHQDAAIFLDLTVAENLALGAGFETGPAGAIRWKRLHARARDVLARFELDVDPDTPAALLGPARRTMLAIARALQDQEDATDSLLVLDEPTASLPAHEVELLTAAIRRFAARGQTILYVSHRLDEVRSLADRVSVLRDGRRVATVDADGLTEDALIELLVGRALERVYPDLSQIATLPEVALALHDVSVGPLRDVSLRVSRGEVVGVAGLLGSGRTELLQGIFGALPLHAGHIELEGERLRLRSPADAMAAGIAYVPEDRADQAAFMDLSVRDNLAIGEPTRHWAGIRFRHRAERADTGRALEEFGVKAASPDVPLSSLSGGNQQKVILARWLRRGPRVLLLDEPTQGVDVGARAEIYQLVRAAVEGGAAVLVVSSDPEELVGVCDRVVVLAGGRLVADVPKAELDAARLTDLAYPKEPVA